MKVFSLPAKISIALVCIISILIAFLNFIETDNKFLDNMKINLGLDLRGGAYVTLQVDLDSYDHSYFDIVASDIKKDLSDKKISYSEFKTSSKDFVMHFSLLNPDDHEKVKDIISKIDDDISVSFDSDDNIIKLSYAHYHMGAMHKNVIRDSIENIRRRIDSDGTKEIAMQKKGEDKISLQIPGQNNYSDVRALLQKTAKLTFHMVDSIDYQDDNSTAISHVMSDIQNNTMYDAKGVKYKVNKNVELDGSMLNSASVSRSEKSGVSVSFKLNPDGTKKFATLTQANKGRNLAVVLDGSVLTAPTINEPILTGSGEITGNFDMKSANELALMLRAGALPAPLNIVNENFIGPSLGEDSIKAGQKSIAIAFIAVVAFIIFYYKRFGVYASIALAMNLILIIAFLSLLGATLTLPGIAGMVLTIGMSVDTNVLIFERIKEELKNNKKAFVAVDKGFKGAFATIMDSNITTLVAALILFISGSGPVRGFSVTLIIGILSSLFSAITLTQFMIVNYVRKSKIKELVI